MKSLLALMIAFSWTAAGEGIQAVAMFKKMTEQGRRMFDYAIRDSKVTRYRTETPEGIRIIEPKLKERSVLETFGSYDGGVQIASYSIPRSVYPVLQTVTFEAGDGVRLYRQLGIANKEAMIEEITMHAGFNVRGKPLRVFDKTKSTAHGRTLTATRETSGKNEILRLNMKWEKSGKESQLAIPIAEKWGKVIGWEALPDHNEILIFTSEGTQLKYSLQHKDNILTSTFAGSSERSDYLRMAYLDIKKVEPQKAIQASETSFELPPAGAIQ